MSIKKLSKLYTAVIVMLPAINVYRSLIPSIELGTFLILLCTTFFFLDTRNRAKVGIDKIWGVLLIVFLLCTFIATTINTDYNIRYFFRYLKIVVIVVSIMFYGKTYFNYKYATKTLRYFSIVCSVFIIIQTVLYNFGVFLPGIIMGLVSIEGELADQSVFSIYRPSAFFFEPAHFACYQFVFLSYLLSNSGEKKRNILIALTFLSIFFSTSGTGLVIAPILVFASIILGERKNKIKYAFYGAILVASFIFLITNTHIGQDAIGRFINENGEVGGAATGRLDSGADVLFDSLPTILQWIGCGFGYRPEEVYFPSLYAILYGDGYIGLVTFALLGLIYFVKTSLFGRLLLIAYYLLFMGAGVFNFGTIGLYFMFISLETAFNQKTKFLTR